MVKNRRYLSAILTLFSLLLCLSSCGTVKPVPSPGPEMVLNDFLDKAAKDLVVESLKSMDRRSKMGLLVNAVILEDLAWKVTGLGMSHPLLWWLQSPRTSTMIR